MFAWRWDRRQCLLLSCRAESHWRPHVARRRTSCAVLAIGHWQVSRWFLKGEFRCSYFSSWRGSGTGQPREKHGVDSVAPPPSPPQSSLTRSYPSIHPLPRCVCDCQAGGLDKGSQNTPSMRRAELQYVAQTSTNY